MFGTSVTSWFEHAIKHLETTYPIQMYENRLKNQHFIGGEATHRILILPSVLWKSIIRAGKIGNKVDLLPEQCFKSLRMRAGSHERHLNVQNATGLARTLPRRRECERAYKTANN